MLTVLLAAGPGSNMTATMLPVLDAFVARGHRVVFIGDADHRGRIERSGAVFVDVGRAHPGAEVVPSAFLPGVQQIDVLVRQRLLSPLRGQWQLVQRTIDEHGIEVVVSDPAYLGAAALAQLPRARRPALVLLGAFPLSLPDPLLAPYGLGMPPSERGTLRVRNVLLHLLITGVLLRRVTRDVKRHLHELTGARMRGTLFDASRYADALAQLTVTRFEYPRSRTHANLVFVGPLRPPERGVLPDWWDYADDRPVIVVRHEQGTAFEDLVLPALEGLRHEDVLVVVTGATEAQVVEAGGRPLPRNARVERALPYAHLLASAKVVVKAGDYVQTQYALRWGVPLVVAGTAEEQVETNARVEWAGAGVNLRTARPSPQQMRVAVMRVLHDPSMRRAAARIAAQIAPTDAEGMLCDLAEHLAAGVLRDFRPASAGAAPAQER